MAQELKQEQDEYITVLNGAVKLWQAPDGFRTSLDSVMLAAACPARGGEHVLDLGCGVGSAGLCVAGRIKGIKLTGVDIQADHVRIAQKNAALNSVEKNSNFICSDIRDLPHDPVFEHVICNPPYFEHGRHTHSPSDARATAMGHKEDDISLREWVACAFNQIKGQGSLTIIHQAGALDRILAALKGQKEVRMFGATQIIPLWPRAGQAAKRVIVRSWKHRKSDAEMLPGLALHDEDGCYTKEAEEILRGGKGLFL